MKPGDKYDFKGRAERRLAIALGWVKRTFDDGAPEVVEEVAPEIVEEVVAEVIETEEEKPIAKKPRRSYMRRDLTAEE